MFYPKTDRFREVLPTAESLRVFRMQYESLCPRQVDNKDYITDDQLDTIWTLLAAKYSECHINFTSQQPFKMKLLMTIGEVAPKFLMDLGIQHKLATLDINNPEDMAILRNANSIVANHADHPATDPDTDSLDSLTYIDSQDISTSQRGHLESLAYLSTLMRNSLYSNFVAKFKSLFIVIALPEYEFEGEDSKIQDIKEVTITHNGQTTIGPDLGFDHMNNVVVDVQVGEGARVQEEKTIAATSNGTYEVRPDEGYDAVAKPMIIVNVPQGGNIQAEKEISIAEMGPADIYPDDGYDGIAHVIANVDIEAEQVSRVITSNGHVTIRPSGDYEVIDTVDLDIDVPTSGSVENFKTVVVNQNGSSIIRPSEGYDYMSNVVLNVGVPTPTVETSKSTTITENGVKSIFPSSGFDAMGRVNVTVNVQGGGGDVPSFLEWFEEMDWTPSTNIQTPYTIEYEDHGSLPNFLYIWLDKPTPTYNREFGGCVLFSTPSNYVWNNSAWSGNMFYRQTIAQWFKSSPSSSNGVTEVNDMDLTIKPNDYSGQQCIFLAGNTYHIFVGRFADAEV